MILFYSSRITERLNYILAELLQNRLGLRYELTDNPEYFSNFNGPKINYSTTTQEGCLNVYPAELLFETAVREQHPKVTAEKWWTYKFFSTPEGDLPFDVFAASFYLLSRYEEYLYPYADAHDRFDPEKSLAYTSGFLQIPLVDCWTLQLKWELEHKLNYTQFHLPGFRFISTIDIDFAYRYRGIGFIRYWLKFLNELFRLNLRTVLEQLNVGISYRHDPYDTYRWIQKIAAENKSELMFFILLCNGTAFDKNIIPHHPVMEKLVEKLSDGSLIGLHPSYYTSENPDLLLHEKQQLETYLNLPVLHSRQHFLRYRLPLTFEQLETIGLRNDYSVGYATLNGFRASTAHSFGFFNLRTNETGTLLLHPISIMDVGFKNNPAYTPKTAYLEIEKLMSEVKKVNGTFISVWHNSNLSHHEGWKPWKEVFQKMHTLAASKATQEID